MGIEPAKDYAVDEVSPERGGGGFEMRSWSQLGGTDADEHDMRALGRTQQLNVCISQASPWSNMSPANIL